MLPAVADYFEGTAVGEFFRRIIPVSMDVWILFFLLPFVLALAAEVILLFRAKSVWPKLVVPGIALLLPVLVFGCSRAEILQPVFGGFVGLLLLGTSVFLLAASLLAWGIRALCFLRTGVKR